VPLWRLASLAFSFLLSIFPDYGATYGGFGVAIARLLYLYVSTVAVLLGAGVNAAILERVSLQGATKAELLDSYRG
jgi:membrane protein